MTTTPTAGGGRSLLSSLIASVVALLRLTASPAALPVPPAPAPAANAVRVTPALPPGVTEQDLDLAVRTLYGEARGEPDVGVLAVAHVILNRWRRPSWWSRKVPGYQNDTIAAVCRRRWQFTCWNEGDPNREKMLALKTSDPAYQRLRGLFLKAFTEPDFTSGATHYYAAYIAAPSWVEGAVFTGQHGVHRFYTGLK